jgi:hypothetical protein
MLALLLQWLNKFQALARGRSGKDYLAVRIQERQAQ